MTLVSKTPSFIFNSLFIAILATQTTQIANAKDVVTLPNTTVWGTKVFSTSSSLGEQDFASRQADHLADLLRDQPGVDVGGTHSVNQRLNIRGLDDTDLEVTLDGASQNTFMFHHAGNLIFNADILKSIETRVGNNSVVNGGLGGSIAMETKDPSDLLKDGENRGARVHASASTNKAATGSLTLFGKTKNGIDGLVYATYLDKKNPNDGSGIEIKGQDGEIKNLLAKVGFNFGAYQRIELSHDWYKDEGDYSPRPDMGSRTNTAISGSEIIPTRFERHTTAINHEGDIGENHSIKTHLSVNKLDFNRDYTEEGKVVYYGGESVNTRFNLTAMSDVQLANTKHAFTYGVDVLSQTAEAKRDDPTTKEKSLSAAVFIEDDIALGSRINVVPGVRFENYKAESATSDKTHRKVLGALAVEGKLNDNLVARASARQLFKGPELAEVFINEANRLVKNPNIKPETGLNSEIGLEYSKKNALGLDRLSWKITAFKTDINDYIDSEDYPNDELIGRRAPSWFVNKDDVTVKGGELSVYMKHGNGGMRLGYATSDSKFDNSGLPLARELGDKLTVGFDYAIPQSGITINLTGINVFDEDRSTLGKDQTKPGYFVANAALGYTPISIPDLNLHLNVDNLFDKQYASHASRVGNSTHPRFGALHLTDYEPGRNVKLSASYQF